MKFKEYSFKDLLIDIVDNRGKTCPTAEIGIPLIATNCIKNDSLYPVFEKVRYVDDETYNNWFRGHPKPGDMIFVCKGSPGRVAWVPDPINFCIAQDMVAIRADATKVYPKYLFALLRSEQTQQKILNMHVGTLIPHFKKGDFGNLYFDIPEDFEYQKQVGDAYFSFCEKIEHNQQINQTLEQIAQAIFKSWFVDFDPVKAKIAAKQNGQDPERAAMCVISGKTDEELDQLNPEQRQQLAATAALFPDELVDSELGGVPEGWNVKPLPELIDFLEGPGIRNWQCTEEEDGIKFINIRCIQNGDIKLDTASKITKEEAFGKYAHFQLEVDDIVVSTSGTLGRFAFVRQEHLPLSLNTSVIRFRPLEGHSTLHFIRGFVETQLQWELEMRASGSAQRNFGPIHLKQISILQPNIGLLNKHAEICEPLFRQRQTNLNEIDALTVIRDSLLPILISGEITLGDTQSTAEAVA